MTKQAEFKALTIYCPNKKRQVRIEQKDVNWDFGESECELCGSHGNLNVSFKCKCGKTHNIELESW